MLNINIVFATQTAYRICDLQVIEGTTLLQAIQQSGILEAFPDIDLKSKNRVGIYGKIKDLNDIVEDKDRIEIYRPLYQDPILARKIKVKQRRQQALNRAYRA